MKNIPSLILLSILTGCTVANNPKIDYTAYMASEIVIDGLANEQAWKNAEWYQLDQRWLGEPYTENDFSGRFKLTWDENYLYLLAEIKDDSLVNQYNGTERYWDDDILEIFIDEDASGGNHQYNYNAFAYHVDAAYDVFDIDTDSSAYHFNDHIDVKYSNDGNTYIWETAIKVYDDGFTRKEENKPVKLHNGIIMGFALAYCDNDTSTSRENFVGSEIIEGQDKDRGWIDAGIFGTLRLSE